MQDKRTAQKPLNPDVGFYYLISNFRLRHSDISVFAPSEISCQRWLAAFCHLHFLHRDVCRSLVAGYRWVGLNAVTFAGRTARSDSASLIVRLTTVGRSSFARVHAGRADITSELRAVIDDSQESRRARHCRTNEPNRSTISAPTARRLIDEPAYRFFQKPLGSSLPKCVH